MDTPGFLDWHAHPVGPSLPCRICAQPAMCRDHLGPPLPQDLRRADPDGRDQ
jgi:hypothetical protein